MRATIWRVSSKNEKPIRYRLQFDKIRGKRAENKVLKELSGWSRAGHGFKKETQETTLLFVRTFKDKDSMLQWAEEFPYELHEQTSRGNIKKIKTNYSKKG
jgi:hypothetical protein